MFTSVRGHIVCLLTDLFKQFYTIFIMKRLFLFLTLFTFFHSISFSQRNYAQELIDLMNQGRCIEAREFRSQYADKLPLDDVEYNLYYNWHMANFLNKPDSAAIYMKDLIANHEFFLGSAIPSFYMGPLRYYIENQEFEKCIKLLDRAIDFFNRNPFDYEYDFVKNSITHYEKLKTTMQARALNEPRIRIERHKRKKDDVIKLNDGKAVLFNAMYNGVEVETLLHPGTSDCFMITKNLAEKIGIKAFPTDYGIVIEIPDVSTKTSWGMLDCVDLKNVKLYNMPVVILDQKPVNIPDSVDDLTLLDTKSLLSDDLIIMGTQAMRLIGKIELDRTKEAILSFPENTQENDAENSPNIFFKDNMLHTQMKINEQSFMGRVTLFDSFLNILPSFYEKNKNYIEIDSIRETEASRQFVKNAKIYFDGKYIKHLDDDVVITDKSNLNSADGRVGMSFLFGLGTKVVIDFQKMRIEGKD